MIHNFRGRPAPSSSRRAVFIGLGLLGIAGIVLLERRWTAAVTNPVVPIPTPVLPHPNAFDFYLSAGNALTGDKQIADALSSQPKAAYTLEQKEALVRQNSGVIDTLHKGFAYPYCSPPCRSFDHLFPYFVKFRSVARLLSLRGQVRAAHGDWNGATDSFLDAIRIGEDIPHGSPLIGDLVGIACQAIGRRPMWDVVEHLNAAQSRSVIARLTRIAERHLPYPDTIQEEKWTLQASLLEVFSSSKKQADLLNSSDSSDTADSSEKLTEETASSLAGLLFLAYSKTRIMNNLTNYMDQYAQDARQSYGLHPNPPPLPPDPVNRAILPIFTGARLKNVVCETQNGLMLVTLALHAFRLEQGHYPASLAELAPAYLAKLPEDPFAVQGAFKYLPKGDHYVLYSIGPDGKDDGGTAIDDVKNSTGVNLKSRYFVEQKSVGDIVVGINKW